MEIRVPLSEMEPYYEKGYNEARKNALAQISSQISVTISSNTLTTKKVTNDTYERDVQNTLKASTQNIKFTGVENLDTTFTNGSFYEYIQVQRGVLFSALKKDFDIEYKTILDTWSHIEKGNPFLLFTKASELENGIIKSISNLAILKSIKTDFVQDSYLVQLQDIRKDFQTKKSTVEILVETTNAKGEKAIIEQAISQYGIKIASSLNSTNDKNNLLRVNIDKKAKKAPNLSKSRKMQDVIYADITLNITTYNATKKVKLAQNVLSLRNGTRESYEASVIKTKKFEREIEEKGILKILLENI
jgi:hypothetical protein